MAYSAPLSEKIRIQVEIFCENCTDCISTVSQNYKKQVLALLTVAVLLTMRASRRGIKTAKMSGYSTTYGKKKGFLDKLKGGSGYSSTGSSLYGGSSYGAGGGYGATGGAGSTYGPGLRGTSAVGGAGYASSLGGGSTSFGGTGTSFGAMGGGMTGAAGGKGTGTLADSNPTAVMTLDSSLHFYDYGGTASFYGQIETVQAPDAPNFVSQVLNQPGQNKVLVIDGGGIRADVGAVFDADMGAAALRNGWKGVVVYGAVRGVAQLSRSQIGVKALGTSPKKGNGAMGQKGGAISVGSTQLQPGWWIYADADGVIISQTDISGGSFGSGGGGFGAGGSSLAGGFGSANTMGGTSAFGTQGSTLGAANALTGGYGANGGAMAGTAGAAGGLTGGYGAATGGGLTGGYSSTAGAARTSMGSTYGSSAGGLTGGYGSSTSYGGAGSSSLYGRSTYSSYGSARKKKNKAFKMLLASSIAAIVWIVCLR